MAALRSTLVLACRPGCEAMGMRAAGLGRGWLQHFEIATELSCALTRGLLGREFVPHAEILSFASPKESIQRKGDPTFAPSALRLRVPCASHLKRRLRNSHQPCGLLLKQSSPTTPFQPAMLGARDGSPVRGAANTAATSSSFFGGQLAAHPTQAGQAWSLAFPRISPVGHAEHRRSVRGSRRGLFERPQDASSAAAARFEKRRATRSAAQGVTSGSPSLGYLSWRDKKGTVPAGHPRHLNQSRASAPSQPESQFSGRTPSPQPLSLKGRGAMTAPLQPALLLPLKHACKPIPERLAGRYAKEARHA
jgi:hypothetical protein